MIEKIEEIVARQVEAVKNLKIDKITVWDSGSGDRGGSSTSNFLSSMIKVLPPLQDIAGMAGVQLPEYLGRMAENEKMADAETAKPKSAPTETKPKKD
jgi:flotillin